jgi:phospholipid-transporting ATPase
MIPISLYVAIEVLKLSQGLIVSRDVEMYDPETRQFANCKNSDLTEELGQVQIIFSDKTGTLTQNKMEFKKCQIAGKRFGEDILINSGSSGMSEKAKEEVRLAIISGNTAVSDFFKALALCHTVVCE